VLWAAVQGRTGLPNVPTTFDALGCASFVIAKA